MEDYSLDEENGEKVLEQEGLESTEKGFLKGYTDDEEVEECAECGSALDEESRIAKEVDGENYVFCSETCVKEFEDSLN